MASQDGCLLPPHFFVLAARAENSSCILSLIANFLLYSLLAHSSLQQNTAVCHLVPLWMFPSFSLSAHFSSSCSCNESTGHSWNINSPSLKHYLCNHRERDKNTAVCYGDCVVLAAKPKTNTEVWLCTGEGGVLKHLNQQDITRTERDRALDTWEVGSCSDQFKELTTRWRALTLQGSELPQNLLKSVMEAGTEPYVVAVHIQNR